MTHLKMQITMKKLTLVLLFLLTIPLYAQQTSNDSIKLWSLQVVDGFFEKDITQAHISVYEPDSTTMLLDSVPKIYLRGREQTDETFRCYGGCMLPLRNTYLL